MINALPAFFFFLFYNYCNVQKAKQQSLNQSNFKKLLLFLMNGWKLLRINMWKILFGENFFFFSTLSSCARELVYYANNHSSNTKGEPWSLVYIYAKMQAAWLDSAFFKKKKKTEKENVKKVGEKFSYRTYFVKILWTMIDFFFFKIFQVNVGKSRKQIAVVKFKWQKIWEQQQKQIHI